MAYDKKITLDGINFINHVCTTNMSGIKRLNYATALSGKQNYSFPYSGPPFIDKIWTCNIKVPNNPNKIISSATELAEALIYWFNKYSEIYGLDANVIAAQAFAESGYLMWNYAGYNRKVGFGSTASGVNQFTMSTVYGVIIINQYPVEPYMTPDEIAKITAGLDPQTKYLQSSYIVGNNLDTWYPGHEIAWKNRPILHQNVIDNPDIMIKAQCRYMRYAANKCDGLTSSSLFGYSRGPNGYALKSYTEAVQKCKKNETAEYLKEGLDYVMKIFGILGDKDNWLASKGLGPYYKPAPKIVDGKTIYYYFGYDENMGNSPKNLRLKETFSAYNSNSKQSNELYPNNPPTTPTTTTT